MPNDVCLAPDFCRTEALEIIGPAENIHSAPACLPASCSPFVIFRTELQNHMWCSLKITSTSSKTLVPLWDPVHKHCFGSHRSALEDGKIEMKRLFLRRVG